jgi:hypothetical protein
MGIAMKRTTALLSVWMLTIPATTSFAGERFGGKWPTTVSCDGTGRL